MSQIDDSELLADIAQRKDEKAFGRLYRRHGTALFNLALRITRDPSLADEATQEALLSIWKSAATFRTKGSARAWLMRVAAMEALKMLQAENRERIRVRRAAAASPPEAVEGVPDPAEHEEVLSALKAVLDGLPAAQQQMLALHYGGGLNQYELSQALQMPQRTVSFRLNKLFGELRVKMTPAGVAALTDQFLADSVREALCTGSSVPGGLYESAWDRIAEAGSKGKERSEPIGGWTPATGILGAVAVLLLAIPGVWWALEPQAADSGPEEQMPLGTEPKRASPPMPAREDSLLYRRTFEGGPANDLDLLFGRWKEWRPARGKRKSAMVAWSGAPNHVVALLPLKVSKEPFVVTLDAWYPRDLVENFIKRTRASPSKRPRLHAGVRLCFGTTEKPFNLSSYVSWHRANVLNLSVQEVRSDTFQLRRYEIYHADAYTLTWDNGRLTRIDRYTIPLQDERVGISVFGFGVEQIEIRRISKEDLPPALREPERMVQKIQNEIAAGASEWALSP